MKILNILSYVLAIALVVLYFWVVYLAILDVPPILATPLVPMS